MSMELEQNVASTSNHNGRSLPNVLPHPPVQLGSSTAAVEFLTDSLLRRIASSKTLWRSGRSVLLEWNFGEVLTLPAPGPTDHPFRICFAFKKHPSGHDPNLAIPVQLCVNARFEESHVVKPSVGLLIRKIWSNGSPLLRSPNSWKTNLLLKPSLPRQHKRS